MAVVIVSSVFMSGFSIVVCTFVFAVFFMEFFHGTEIIFLFLFHLFQKYDKVHNEKAANTIIILVMDIMFLSLLGSSAFQTASAYFIGIQ